METTVKLDNNFNVDFQGINEEYPKPNKKTIIVLSTTISVAIALIATIFLVGYFKPSEKKIQNEKVKKAPTIFLETQKDFGLQNFNYEVISTKNEEEKKEEVLKELEKEKEENEDFEENKKNNEDLNHLKQLRNLYFDGSFSKSWTLTTLNILGKEVILKYEINLEGGKLKNILSVICDNIKFPLGNFGTASNKRESINTGNIKIFTVTFPGTPIPVPFSFIVAGTIEYDVEYDTSNQRFTITLRGSLYARGELAAGVYANQINVGAKGTIINIKSSNILSKISDSFVTQNNIVISGTEISCYASGKTTDNQDFEVIRTFSNAWQKMLN